MLIKSADDTLIGAHRRNIRFCGAKVMIFLLICKLFGVFLCETCCHRCRLVPQARGVGEWGLKAAARLFVWLKSRAVWCCGCDIISCLLLWQGCSVR